MVEFIVENRRSFDIEMTGIYTISIPIPYASGTINVYFSHNPVPTLIDLPPNQHHYYQQLERKLRQIGYFLSKDIQRVIVTHPHFDHCGLASRIAAESGAQIWSFKGGDHYMENLPQETMEDFKYYSSLLEKAGVPGCGSEYLIDFLETILPQGPEARVTHCLEEGDEIQFGSAFFKIIHVPGHTPWCFMMYDQNEKIGFTGDFLIADISSNAVLQRPGVGGNGYKSLKSYIASLHKILKIGVKMAFPGHGSFIPDVPTRVRDILSFIEARRRAILSILVRRRTCTPYEIMSEIFPDATDWHVLLGISEIIGHLELLEEDNMIRWDGRDKVSIIDTNTLS